MRDYVAMVLIICGTLLAMVVPASDFLYSHQRMQIVMDRPELEGVTLMWPLDDSYRFGCWSLGAAMIILGLAANGCRRSAGISARPAVRTGSSCLT